MRADAGSCYTSSKVKAFLISKGSTVQVAAPQAPHQISIAERNHGVLLNTMRAIMHFSCSYNELWALALKYSAVLNNYMAADYNTSAPFIPWLKTGCALDVGSLYPFGCLVLVQRTKAQVDDGKLSPRAEVGAFVGWAVQDGSKAILVVTPHREVKTCVFFKVDVSYFPMRPAGNRRLLPDGTFGNEGETTRLFKENKFNSRALLGDFKNDSLSNDPLAKED